MEVRIGIQHVTRELVLQSNESAESIKGLVAQAVASGGPIELVDERGHLVVVPSSALGYLEIGTEEVRKVGFGVV